MRLMTLKKYPSWKNDDWEKPADWPDLHQVLDQYREADSGYANKIAILLNFPNQCDAIKMRYCQAYRFCDDPDTLVVPASTSTQVEHEFSFEERPKYIWVVGYSNSRIAQSFSSYFCALRITGTTTFIDSKYQSLWIVGEGQAEARMWYGTVRAIELDDIEFNKNSGGGEYFQNNYLLEKFSFKKCSGFKLADVGAMFSNCHLLKHIDVSVIDPSTSSSLNSTFSNCFAITQLDVSKWNVSNVTNFAYTFSSCVRLKKLDVSKWNTSKATTFNRCFYSCASLETLDLSNWDTSNVTDVGSMFYNMFSLKTVDIHGWNLSALTSTTVNLDFPNTLQSLIGGKTLSEVGIPDAATGPRVNWNISTLVWLDHDSLLWLLYWLADLTGQTAQTLTLGTTNAAKLTDDEKAIATAKNWILA